MRKGCWVIRIEALSVKTSALSHLLPKLAEDDSGMRLLINK